MALVTQYALGAGVPEAPEDPLLAWHARARAEHIEPDQLEWRDGRVQALDWRMPGLLISVRVNLDLGGTPLLAQHAKIHGERFHALISGMRDRHHAGAKVWRRAKKDKLAGLSLDDRWRQEANARMAGMRYLVWVTATTASTAAQWRKLMRTWRKHPPYYRVAYWPELDNTPMAAMAYEPIPGDAVGMLSALRWLPTAEPALLSQTVMRMRLRLRGRTPTAPINTEDKPLYQWLFDDYRRATKAATYAALYGG